VNTVAAEAAQHRVLVVDDDADTRTAVCEALRWAGMLCSEAQDVARARRVVVKNRPDIVILDLSLPDGDGLDFLRELRNSDDLPVLVLSGRDGEQDRIAGLDLGADDYLTKPFSAKELASRVRSVLRRAHSTPGGSRLSFGNVVIDVEARDARRGGQPLHLTTKEFDLLVFLARHPRTVFSRTELLNEVWTGPGDRGEATVTEHVRRLRLKIEIDPAEPRHLAAVRGVGYRLVP
jgi:two-component system phosphate regulon response regulator PhoB